MPRYNLVIPIIKGQIKNKSRCPYDLPKIYDKTVILTVCPDGKE